MPMDARFLKVDMDGCKHQSNYMDDDAFIYAWQCQDESWCTIAYE